MKKILFFHFGSGLGGAPISLAGLVSGLDRNRYEPLVVLTEHGPAEELYRKRNIPVRVESLPSGLFLKPRSIGFRRLVHFFKNYPITIARTRQLIRSEQPDIVHLNSSALFAQSEAVRQEGIPIVWHVREMLRRDTLGRLLLNQIEVRAARIIATTESVAEMFSNRDKVRVIFNGVDLDEFNPTVAAAGRTQVRKELRLKADDFAVVILGTVSDEKGHHILVEAAKEIVLRLPRVRFLIVGATEVSESYRCSWKGRVKCLLKWPMDRCESMKREVCQRELEDFFFYVPFREDIPSVLGAADLVIFPSLAVEGFGRPLMEAMATGRPVLGTRMGSSSEIVEDGRTGWLLNPEDPEDLAMGICRCAEVGDSKLREMGFWQRKRAEKFFDLRQQVKLVEAIYEEILNRGTGCTSSAAGCEH